MITRIWDPIYRLAAMFDEVTDDLIARFNAWAANLDKRNRSGEFGKYPWQQDYGLWPWQRRRR